MGWTAPVAHQPELSLIKVYQQGEVYIGTKKRSKTLTEKGKSYQLKIPFEERKKCHARMTRKCKVIDDLIYSLSNVTTFKELLV